MLHLIRPDHLRSFFPPPNDVTRTRRFEGEQFEAGISFFLVDNEPGEGPDLHRHPYPETFIVRAGQALFSTGSERAEAESGDIIVVTSGTPHGFTNLGPGRLEVVCIHAATIGAQFAWRRGA